MNNEEIKKMNIFEKLSKITDEIGVIEKNLDVKINKTSSYKAVGERQVLDGIKPLEIKYRVFSYPFKREIVDNSILTKESEYNGQINKTNSLYMRIKTIYRFVNIDNIDEYIDIDTYGDGIDTGDKAPGKAMTYADKYALMKAYKLSTGDDPDKEASPEEGYKKEIKKDLNKKVTERQLYLLKKIYVGDNLKKVLTKYKINDLSEMPFEIGQTLISINIEKNKKIEEEYPSDGWKEMQE